MSRSSSIHQLTTGPMALEGKRLSKVTESSGKPLAVDFCELIVLAFTGCGYNREAAAVKLKMSPSSFTRAFDTTGTYPAHNTAMKQLKDAPEDVVRRFAALLCERVGLSVGIDNAKVEASVRVADAVLNLMQVAKR